MFLLKTLLGFDMFYYYCYSVDFLEFHVLFYFKSLNSGLFFLVFGILRDLYVCLNDVCSSIFVDILFQVMWFFLLFIGSILP